MNQEIYKAVRDYWQDRFDSLFEELKNLLPSPTVLRASMQEEERRNECLKRVLLSVGQIAYNIVLEFSELVKKTGDKLYSQLNKSGLLVPGCSCFDLEGDERPGKLSRPYDNTEFFKLLFQDGDSHQ